MGPHAAPRVLAGALLAVSVLSGCAWLNERQLVDRRPPRAEPVVEPAPGRYGREVAMNRRWRTRTLSELTAELGPPRLRMSIPGGGAVPGSVAVYGTDPASGCIDAFALVDAPDPVVRDYYCR